MEGPRGCKIDERHKVVRLINETFRISNGYKPTMGEEFQLMLGEENLENIRIILKDKEPVANVNFYKSTILIEGTPVKAASIGAVCTEKSSRGKGYSSLLLDDCERIMKEEGTRLMLVSGTIGLYTKRGCAIAGKCYEFTIKAVEDKNDGIQLIEFDESLIQTMSKLYNKETTRYYRTFNEFKYLLYGAATPWANYAYKTYLVKNREEYCAYVVLRIVNDNEGSWGTVVEVAGDRDIVSKALEEAIKVNSLRHIKYICTFNDPSSCVLIREKMEFKERPLLGTIKILDFEGLMRDLKPYFSQYVDKDIIENVEFHEIDNRYIFNLRGETLEFSDIHNLTKLVFGSNDSCVVDFSGRPLIEKFIKTVFPLPFVWTANLNYQ